MAASGGIKGPSMGRNDDIDQKETKYNENTADRQRRQFEHINSIGTSP